MLEVTGISYAAYCVEQLSDSAHGIVPEMQAGDNRHFAVETNNNFYGVNNADPITISFKEINSID